MVKYAKLINNHPSYAPNPILVDGNWIGNPSGSVYEEQGYKQVLYADQPSEAPDGYEWSEIWTEGENFIQQGWVLVEIPTTDADALVRYANELTGASDETLEEAAETLIKIVKEAN